MFRVSRETDYGIVLLTQLARRRSPAPFTARDLAENAGLSLPMVSKILKRLARAGILTSFRGVRGGYDLARSADDISVADIVDALEGPIGLMPCIEAVPGECDREPHCNVRHNWHLINTRVLATLRQISLNEMAGDLTDASFATATIRPPTVRMESR